MALTTDDTNYTDKKSVVSVKSVVKTEPCDRQRGYFESCRMGKSGLLNQRGSHWKQMNSRKLLLKALNSPQNLRFVEAIKLAEAFGFQLERISGSHHILKRSGIEELVNLQNVRGVAKPYQVRQLIKLVEKHNLRLND
jgi:hypothetical protein